jgi:hypothetical protein
MGYLLPVLRTSGRDHEDGDGRDVPVLEWIERTSVSLLSS